MVGLISNFANGRQYGESMSLEMRFNESGHLLQMTADSGDTQAMIKRQELRNDVQKMSLESQRMSLESQKMDIDAPGVGSRARDVEQLKGEVANLLTKNSHLEAEVAQLNVKLNEQHHWAVAAYHYCLGQGIDLNVAIGRGAAGSSASMGGAAGSSASMGGANEGSRERPIAVDEVRHPQVKREQQFKKRDSPVKVGKVHIKKETGI